MDGYDSPVPGRSLVLSCRLQTFIDEFERDLQHAGPPSWIRFNLSAVVHFAVWLERAGRSEEPFDEATLDAFRRHRGRCRCPDTSRDRAPRVMNCLRRFIGHLRERGYLPERQATEPVAPRIIRDFLRWMKVHRGVVDITLSRYGQLVTDLVSALGDHPGAYSAQSLRKFVLERCRNYRPKTAQMVFSAVRMFLRYLASEGRCRPGLEAALPPLVSWSMQPLPQGLSSGEVQKVLDSCPSNKKGLRDKAILLLLVRLGLRAGDIRRLRFSDISFERATIRVSGKGWREALLPLPQGAGDALLDYLRNGRPQVESEVVFLRTAAPFVPLGGRHDRGTVTGIVQTALQRAGVTSPQRGSHLLRHTAACEMLRQGANIEEIAAILRHRSVATTGIYAKVDLDLLQGVAQPWPEVM